MFDTPLFKQLLHEGVGELITVVTANEEWSRSCSVKDALECLLHFFSSLILDCPGPAVSIKHIHGNEYIRVARVARNKSLPVQDE